MVPGMVSKNPFCTKNPIVAPLLYKRMSPQRLLMRWSCVMMTKSAVMFMKLGKIPRMSVAFIIAFLLLKR